jgi:hypothetical protein
MIVSRMVMASEKSPFSMTRRSGFRELQLRERRIIEKTMMSNRFMVKANIVVPKLLHSYQLLSLFSSLK